MPKCDYGCNNKGNFKFKNGKWCCSAKWWKCPNSKRKISDKTKNQWRSDDGREKLMKGLNDSWTDERREKISNLKKHQWKEGGIYRSVEYASKMKGSHSLTVKQIEERYPLFYKIEEIRESDDRNIEVKCRLHSCRRWFTPTYIQLYERIRHVEKSDGNGGSYFYCCEEHKKECPLFNYRGCDPQKNYSYIPVWLKKKIIELDGNKCILCESEDDLHIHHILPRKFYPHFEYDIDFMITVCKNCHAKIFHQNECSTGKIRSTPCRSAM